MGLVKMVFRDIERELEYKCQKESKTLRDKLDYSNDKVTSPELDAVKRLFQNRTVYCDRSDRKRFQQKVIYATIHGGVYNKRIAEGFGVKVSDIEETYNRYAHFRDFLRGHAEYDNFKEYIYKCAEVAYEEELEKSDSYEKEGKPFDKLIGTNAPYLWLSKELSASNVMVKHLKSQLHTLDSDLRENTIEDEQYRHQADEVKSHITIEEARIRMLLKCINGRRPTAEKKNMFFIELVGINNVVNKTNHQFKKLHIGCFSKAKDLVRCFCSWYNEVHKSEIADNKAELRKEKQKEAYQKKNATKCEGRLKESVAFQTQVFELLIKGKSLRQIAELTKKGYGTVRRASDAIKSLVAQQADPKNSLTF